ncbi:uncharacterized protein LOC125256211 isoform X2 [Megalobrama amblycephala]|uniref:uncharacterized protein LOC125256211 isoform X2 n=1 Tax=Megalobrama amblycephala TaxID=75352 RepID=UPI002013D22B|nr:uncharacterized protein LOC125256211 isoform X2 [Megalobrama amblycephala]
MCSYFRCWWSFTSFYYRAASHQHICHFITEAVLKSFSFLICGLKLLKMFWIVLFCLCFWHLDGAFGDTDEISVWEGDSVTLNSDLTEMKDYVIQWRFGNTLIAEINVTVDRITVYDDVLDGRFRDRLKLDKQTGSLTITNTTTEHAGDYRLEINESVKPVTVKEGDSVTLNSDIIEMKDDDLIRWWFGNENTLIAEINKQVDRITVYDDVLDGRFRDRLKLDNQTGSLTITNTRTEYAGDYVLITGAKRSLKAFRVSVYVSVHCCGPTEAVIRLVLSALVGVATVILLVYDIRSRRAEQHQAHIHTSGSIDLKQNTEL